MKTKEPSTLTDMEKAKARELKLDRPTDIAGVPD